MDYLEKFPPLEVGQCLPGDNIFELVKFSLPRKLQKELIFQRFESVTQGLTDLVEFCKQPETAEENFQS